MTRTAQVESLPPLAHTPEPASDHRSSMEGNMTECHSESKKPTGIVPGEIDPSALQEILAALAFSPRDGDVQIATDEFRFDSPTKPNPSELATPSAKPSQETPPTAAVSLDEDDVATTEEEAESLLSPVRRYASISNNAAASAYVLTLPREITHKEDTNQVSSATSATTKRCKTFPTVDTNIPGAGTVRSSMSYRSVSAKKLPFVPIATRTDSPKAMTLQTKPKHGPANHIYQNTKEVWAWGKDIVFFRPWLCLTEGAISLTARIVTGNGDLEAVDRHLVAPVVGAVDQHVLNPVLTVVGGVFGWNDKSRA